MKDPTPKTAKVSATYFYLKWSSRCLLATALLLLVASAMAKELSALHVSLPLVAVALGLLIGGLISFVAKSLWPCSQCGQRLHVPADFRETLRNYTGRCVHCGANILRE